MLKWYWISLLLMFLTIERGFIGDWLGQAVFGFAFGATCSEAIRRICCGLVHRKYSRMAAPILVACLYNVHAAVMYSLVQHVSVFAILLMFLMGFVWWSFRVLDNLCPDFGEEISKFNSKYSTGG